MVGAGNDHTVQILRGIRKLDEFLCGMDGEVLGEVSLRSFWS